METLSQEYVLKDPVGLDDPEVKRIRSLVARELAASPEANASNTARHEAAKRIALEILQDRAADFLSAGRSMPTLEDDEVMVAEVLSGMFGVGRLQNYLDDSEIENIDINGASDVWLTYSNGEKHKGTPIVDSDDELVELIRSIAARSGLAERRFDNAHPELDIRLPDGSRLSALMGVCKHPVMSVRRHRLVDVSLGQEVKLGLLNENCARFLSSAVKAKKNILIAGRTNSGKTTLLRALANEIPPKERIVTIEQSLELGLDQNKDRHPDCVALETRIANSEGAGEISMADLVRRSLRMNPDRIIVGETLGPEILALLNAMSQGFGSMATIHADSSSGAFRRIASYAFQAAERLPLEATNLLIAGSVKFVVFVDIRPQGNFQLHRTVASIREVVGADGTMVVSNEIFKLNEDGDLISNSPLQSDMAKELSFFGYSQSFGRLEHY